MSEREKSDEQRPAKTVLASKSPEASGTALDIAQLEAALLADIAAFNFDPAQQNANVRVEERPPPLVRSSGLTAFPEIIPGGVVAPRHATQTEVRAPRPAATPSSLEP